ncbi:MAG: putative hydrolase subunit [Nitrospira sp.]|nr:MAG: putative hydrolase subunit [Nitrospira sp.]
MIPLSEFAVTVEFGATIDLRTNELVLAFTAAVDQAGISGLLEIVPTYRSATVYFDPLLTDAVTIMKDLRALTMNATATPSRPSLTHTIPVWYGGAAGPDLPDVARHARLTPEEAGELHASVTYRVFMLGFSPGFPYLGTVPAPLATPRLPTPRKHVAAGSVGIAGSQTGIYPQASPGGWRIIGRTPVVLFSLHRRKPFLLAPGDQVQFVPIEEEEFQQLSGEQA